MSGFPVRPSRDALGPKWKDTTPVLNPKGHVTDKQINLLAWQVAGVGITTPLAWVIASNGGVRLSAGAVWNPNADPALHPDVRRLSTGVYRVEWEAVYPNEDGVDTLVTLIGANPIPQANAFRVGFFEMVGPRVDVSIVDGSGTLTDCKFMLEVR